MQEAQVRSLGEEDPLQKEMATHSNILEWRIPWAEEPGSLHSPRGLKESDRTEQLSFPLHINIFKSKLTVIIKVFLNTAFPLESEDKRDQYISLYYFIVILSVNGFVQSFHKGLSEGLRCSLNQPTLASREKYTALLVGKGFVAFFSVAKGGGETEWR